jgi:hypothetical protein
MITITNVSTDDLFKGTFQQKILVVDKMDFTKALNLVATTKEQSQKQLRIPSPMQKDVSAQSILRTMLSIIYKTVLV